MHDTYSLPPEWHPQSGIQLTWPHAQTDWADYLNQITLTFIDMTRAIARHEKVLIVTPFVDDVRAMVQASVDKALHHNILFRYAPTNDTWARDHAFITLLPEGEGVPRLVDFRFNGWGEKFEARTILSIADCSSTALFVGTMSTATNSCLREAPSRVMARELFSPPRSASWHPTATNPSRGRK